MPCICLRSITLNPTYFSISNVNIIFYVRLVYLGILFQEHNLGVKQGINISSSLCVWYISLYK
jgi:hypothetical protein